MNQITNFCKATLQVSISDLKKLNEYKSELFSMLLSAPVKIIIYTALWFVIIQSNPESEITFAYIVSYFVNVILIDFMIAPFSAVAYYLMDDVKSGNLDVYITKPYPYLVLRFVSNIKSLVLFFPLLFISAILVNPNITLLSFLAMVFSILCAVVITYLLFALVGILSFYVENVLSLRDNVWNIIRLFSGSIIPLAFYPEILQNIIRFLPFQWIYYKPINLLLSGVVTTNDIIIPLIWMGILVILVTLTWKLSLKRYVSQGG